MILLLFGKDTYSSKNKLREIVEEYKKRHQSGLNFTKIDLAKNDFNQLKQSLEIVSMFDEKKLIIVENPLDQNEDSQEELLEYLKKAKIESNEDKILIFWEEKGDSKNSLFQFLKRKAKVQEFKLFEIKDLKQWLKKYTNSKKAKIETLAIDKLIDYVGNDLWQLSNELDKLIAYAKDEIKVEDVELLVKSKVDVNIFETIDALGKRNKKEALRLLADHFKKGENENYLLDRFVYQFRNLLLIRELLDKGASFDALIRETGLHPFVVRKTHQQVRNFDFDELKKIYRRLAEMDLNIKTGKTDAKTALELFVTGL